MIIYNISGVKYTTARELNQFLGYRDDQSVFHLCRLNRDLLGDVLVKHVQVREGSRMVRRRVSLYDVRQCSLILGVSRFSSSEKVEEIRKQFGTEEALDVLVPRRETVLWRELQTVFCGVTEVSYQVKFGRYFVDFLFPRYNLIIELDGPEHRIARLQAKDAVKEAYLTSLGYRVLRIQHLEPDRCVIINQILRAVLDVEGEKK